MKSFTRYESTVSVAFFPLSERWCSSEGVFRKEGQDQAYEIAFYVPLVAKGEKYLLIQFKLSFLYWRSNLAYGTSCCVVAACVELAT